jgi:hypothetical protein
MALAAVQAVLPPRHRNCDVMKVIADLKKRNPRVGEAHLVELVADEIYDDRDLLLDASRYLVRKALVSKPKSAAKVTAIRRQRVAHQEAEKVAVEKLVEKVKVAVLDMEIGGKKLRFLTGAEVGRLGTGFAKLAEIVPADAYVGEVVTETQAAALMAGAAASR